MSNTVFRINWLSDTSSLAEWEPMVGPAQTRPVLFEMSSLAYFYLGLNVHYASIVPGQHRPSGCFFMVGPVHEQAKSF